MAAIFFDHVSKRFAIHSEKTRSLQDLVINTITRRTKTFANDEFWALNDVSFEVPTGQMVGLIGPNGAGKSTILKLASRILKPTRGNVHITGRLNVLIEMTAGFHPELTGRENVFLSAALLGLDERVTRQHLDEIVAFSELEKFIDMQVKHYSSGMYVRLGFAVATCFESEVLLVDEVLAVGDANFQRKCFDRIEEIRARGATILWVTHSMPEVERICDRALLFMNGELVSDGPPGKVVTQYDELRRQTHQVDIGIFSAEYSEYQVPDEMSVDGRYEMKVTIRNLSAEIWPGWGSSQPHIIMLSYHWLDRWGGMFQVLGPGTPLPYDLPPDGTVCIRSSVIPPSVPGVYRLEIDLMADGQGWFSRRGCLGPQVRVQVNITPRKNEAGNENLSMRNA